MSQIYLQRRSTTNENIFTELNAERLLATAFGVRGGKFETILRFVYSLIRRCEFVSGLRASNFAFVTETNHVPADLRLSDLRLPATVPHGSSTRG